MLNRFYPTNKKFTIIPDPLYITSFDPGTVNLGIRIEKRYKERKVKVIWFRILVIKRASMAETLVEWNEVLHLLLPIFMRCHLFILEQQLSKINPSITRIYQATLTYLMVSLRYSPQDPIIYDVHSQLAKRHFSVPRGTPRLQMKKQLHEKAKEIAMLSGDLESYNILISNKSDFEYSDTTVQIEAVCKLEGYPVILSP